MQSGTSQKPRLWPLAAIVAGVLLLLSNFRIFTFNILELWPLLLIALALQVLWRGDIGLTWQAQTFGVTRGSVERATLEADSGELDVTLNALQKEGRLLAGRYTARSRPRLAVQHNEATIKMRRGETWPLSLADWEVSLAQDLLWRLLLSAGLGEINADLRALDIEEARIATGTGNIHLICPGGPAGPIWARSNFGSITVEVPEGAAAAVRVRCSPLSKVRTSERFEEVEPGLWLTAGYPAEPETALSIEVISVVGDVTLS